MTHNAIAYFSAKNEEVRNLEQARHNKEVEANERRAQAITKAYNDYYLQIADFREKEVQRHNLATERLNNLANYLTSMQIANDQRRIEETQRHNLVSERNDRVYNYWHNERERERNAETARHNATMESLQSSQQEWDKTRDKWDLFFQGISSFTRVKDSNTKRLEAVGNTIQRLTRIYSD